MYLQTARYLIKAWNQGLNNEKLTPTVSYLANYTNNYRPKFENSPQGILRAFQSAAAQKIAKANQHLEERKKYFSPEEAANQTGIELAKAAELHCQAFLLQATIEVLEDSSRNSSKKLGGVFIDILNLYAVDLALRYIGNLLEVTNYPLKLSIF